MKKTACQINSDFNSLQVELIVTELSVGHTFATLALETDSETKRARNQHNARKAYDNVLRILGDSFIDKAQAKQIEQGLQRLESELRQLGETEP